MFLIFAMLATIILPTVMFARNIGRSHMFWPQRAHREKTQAQAGSGAFRATTVQTETQTTVPAGPPKLLQLAAYSGYYLGQMAIPGVLMGMVGVMVATMSAGSSNPLLGILALLGSVAGIGLCLYAATTVWSAANTLFESKFEVAEAQAKRALLFANIINIPTILIAVFAALGGKDPSVLGFTFYPIISLMQAAFVLWAVRRHESDFREAIAEAMPSQASVGYGGVRVETPLAVWPEAIPVVKTGAENAEEFEAVAASQAKSSLGYP